MQRLSPLKQLAEAEKQRREGRERQRQRLLQSSTRATTKSDAPVQARESPSSELPPTTGVTLNLCQARSGAAQIPIYLRGQVTSLWPQPWLHEIVDAALQTASKHEIRLVLVWPGQTDPLALVHALATLERYAAGDKQGLRALIYPTTRLSFSPLAHTLVDREKLLEWVRHYLTVAAGAAKPLAGRDNQNKDMMLMALQTARNAHPELEHPTLSELLPHFEWDRTTKAWGHYGDRYLRRSKGALERSHKRALFTKEDDGRITQLGNPELAPDALFGISHLTTPRERRDAIKSKALGCAGRQPELVLFDLTRAMQHRAERPIVRQVLDAMKEIGENWKSPCGFMISTDDPKTFFVMRKALDGKFGDRQLRIQALVTASRGSGLAQSPLARDWVPSQVSLKRFRVSILDQEAASVAVRFWSLAEKLEEGSEAAAECRKTSAYLLRLANLPSGYADFTSWMTSQEFADSVQHDMSWVGCEYRLNALIDRGAFAAHVEEVRRVITRGGSLVETYAEATPLASRLAREIGVCVSKAKATVVVLFRFSSDIAVAQSFLRHYPHFPNNRPFSDFSDRVSFHNHRELAEILAAPSRPSKFIFVGLPDETLRLLVSSEDIPADSVIIVDYRRANDVLIGLRALRSIDAFKAYRGRISGLAIEIERQFEELPTAIDLEKLERVRVPRLSLSTVAAESSRATETPGAWRVEIEGGRHIAVSQRVYVYEPDEAALFKHEDVENLKPGDLIFVMSDPLKDLLESCLIAAGHPVMRGATLVEMIREYHRQVLRNAKRLFGDLEGTALARRVQARMVEFDTGAKPVSLGRIRYWTDVDNSSAAGSQDLKPHSTRQRADFVLFAKALEIPENLIDYYWMMITGHRRDLQEAGRELADRYARVLFSEESAETHYHLSRETILMLQREAVQNTFRVIRAIPPTETRKHIHASTG